MLSILLIEDNPGDVVLVREMLKSAGLSFQFKHVSTLQDSLKLCVEHYYDIILLDLGLPDSGGIETLKKIHAFNVNSPLIVMTGLDDEDIALASLREGAQDYLVKSRLTSDIILRSIKYSIERKKIQDLQKLYAQRFSILSECTGALNEYEDIPTVFRIICKNIRILVHNAQALAFDFPAQNNLRISGIDWMSHWFEQIQILTGYDMSNPVFRLTQHGKSKLLSVCGNHIKKIDDAIYEVCEGVMDHNARVRFENMLNIHHVYSIGFHRQSSFYGGMIIFCQRPILDEDIKIIEAISSQTSLNIQRRFIEFELRNSEDRYRMLAKDLEVKIHERTKDIEQVNEQLNKELFERIQAEKALRMSEQQLKELNATKDKFFNIVAHDLKNPFTSLLGSSELLFQNIDHLDLDHIKKLAIILNDSAKSGYAILQNLLDWSRSQTGTLKYNPENVNLKKLIDENIVNLELFCINKEITIDALVDDELIVYADKNMLNTVIRNLVSNALKFSYRSSKVLIKAIAKPNEILVSVKDYGTGIPDDCTDKIFRIDSKYTVPGTENEQGTGLGLKLSKEFVERLGGKIWVESTENKGSEFIFTIAVRKPEIRHKSVLTKTT